MKFLSLVIIVFLLSGCGVTGTASQPTFAPLTNAPQFRTGLAAVQVEAAANAADNAAYGAFNWGKFDQQDQKVIKQAIYSAVNANAKSATNTAKVHVYIHRYSQVITNASYASFVIVDWCLEQDGKILVDEVFYAGHADELNIFTGKSLGWAKGETHKAISGRIINQVIANLSEPSRQNAYAEPHVFLDAAAAVKALPAELTSVGSGGMAGGTYFYIEAQSGDTDFAKKALYQKVDWAARLKAQQR
jgi:hypothetical protein